MVKILLILGLFTVISLSTDLKSQSLADSGYYYLNKGDKKLAGIYFENYLKENPKDTKIRMQLGYMYYDDKKYIKALQNFRYVGTYSKDEKDIDQAKSAVIIIREEMSFSSPRSMDLYFYNYYDSYQENYIANLIGHYNFKIAPEFYTGFYLNVYTDTRSKPGYIYNDRFAELGGFLRYSFLRNLFLEFRMGYAREIDLDKNTINIEPLLVYFNRFGNARVYVSSSKASKTDFYFDLYSVALYDYKFQNAFGQLALQEVLRIHTGGYSYLEPYLVQNLNVDSRRVHYNNYGEVGGGLRFQANVPYFPVLFVEPVYRGYFFGDPKNTFTVKGGFTFNFRTPL